MTAGSLGFNEQCLDAAHNDPVLGLIYAVVATRWRLIANGELTPDPDEPLPVEVTRARHEHAA